jgi:hypothetical protein
MALLLVQYPTVNCISEVPTSRVRFPINRFRTVSCADTSFARHIVRSQCHDDIEYKVRPLLTV